MSTHTTGGSIAPLDSGSVGFGLAELVEHLMNERAGAMGIANFGADHPTAFAMRDDLNVSQRAGNAIANIRQRLVNVIA